MLRLLFLGLALLPLTLAVLPLRLLRRCSCTSGGSTPRAAQAASTATPKQAPASETAAPKKAAPKTAAPKKAASKKAVSIKAGSSKPSRAKEDDLRKIEGIGPKIASTLKDAGIRGFDDLAASTPDALRQVLDDAGIRIAFPESWPEQAQLAAAGKWDALEALQATLQGGRRV